MNERARQALSLRERGWFVFPVKSPDEPEQKKPGKEPAIKWRTAVSTPESIEWWWRNRPARNIGIDCGRSDLVVLDEDAAGELERLSADHGVTIPATYTVITSRGRQLYFEANPRYPIRNKVHLEGYAIDVRGDGGLVVAAGSVHESGHVYAAVDPHAPAAPLPDEIAKLVVESAPERKTSDADRFLMGTDWQQEVNLAAGEGRNNAFYRYSSALIGLGLSDTEIRRLVTAAWTDDLEDKTDFTLDEALRTAESAMKAGYEPATHHGVAEQEELRFLSPKDMETLTPPPALIDGLLYENTLVQLSGPPGSYKSFLALSLALAVAAGPGKLAGAEGFSGNWLGFEVRKQGPVVYLAAEGLPGLTARAKAWCDDRAPKLDFDELPIGFLGDAVQLDDRDDRNRRRVDMLIAAVKERGAALLVLDTRARCTVGQEENSATDMGLAVDAAERIRREAGATVLVVHHSPKTGGGGRGSNVWDGAVHSDIRVEKDGDDGFKLECAKHKDAPAGCKHPFGIKPHTVPEEAWPGKSEDDRNTLVIVRNGGRTLGAGMNETTIGVLKIIRTVAGQTAAPRAEVRNLAMEELKISRTTAYEHINQLRNAGLTENVGTEKNERYVLTPKGESLLRQAESSGSSG
ncbi:AAA family ATPase [Rhodococcus hoagii]|nr:AAA family ATPase [Prescottella equi]